MLMVGVELRFVLKKTASVMRGHLLGKALAAYGRSVWQNMALNTSSFPGIAAAAGVYSAYNMQETVL